MNDDLAPQTEKIVENIVADIDNNMSKYAWKISDNLYDALKKEITPFVNDVLVGNVDDVQDMSHFLWAFTQGILDGKVEKAFRDENCLPTKK